MVITFENYQEEAHKFASYEHPGYPALGLIEEFGEMVGKIAKSLRGDKKLDLEDLKKEIGDIMWMLAEMHSQSNTCFNGLLTCIDAGICTSVKYMSFDDFISKLSVPVRSISSRIELVIHYYNLDLKEILQMNIDKLQSRKDRGVIKGDGDNR